MYQVDDLTLLNSPSSSPCFLCGDLDVSFPTDVLSGDPETAEYCADRAGASGEHCRQVCCDAGRTTTADDIPESALLDIFDFYRITFQENVYVWGWHVLAHVCRKWRQVVFASPARLGLRLHCTPMTPVRKMLDIWPPSLPIVVDDTLAFPRPYPDEEDDNMIAALEQHDRVCVVIIDGLERHRMERLATAMQEPFPALAHLLLRSGGETVAPPTLPATFMGGSAPRLQRLALRGISFPALPDFVLSPNDLTSIALHDIPSTGYISPEAMVAFLSTLTRLEYLTMEFESPTPLPAGPTSRTATPPTRALLPALVNFRFKGVSEYLEDVVARIDSPLLSNLDVEVFNQLAFDTPQFSLFIHRTETLKSHCKLAELLFMRHHVLIRFSDRLCLGLSLCVPCSPSDWQLSSVVQLCGPPFPLSWSVERLDISEDGVDTETWQDNIDRAQWLEILQLFTSVRELCVTETMWHILAPDLNEHNGERTMDVLPMLRDLFLEKLGPLKSLPKTIEPFVTARKRTGHPVVVHRREERGWKPVD